MIKSRVLFFQFVSVLFFVFLFNSNSYAKNSYVLTYNQLRALSSEDRATYLKGLAKIMTKFDQKSVKFSWLNLLGPQFAEANGTERFRCLGGGIPVRLQSEFYDNPRGQSCGASSYAGFSCPSGQEICNPIIFGVRENGEPVCFRDATTQRCYDSVVTGRDTFFPDELFDTDEMRQHYAEFRRDFDQLCSSDGQVEGGQRRFKVQACELARNQMRVNLARLSDGRLSSPHITDAEELSEAVGATFNQEIASGEAIETPSGRGYSLHSREYADAFIRMCEARGVREQLCEEAVSPNRHSMAAFRRIYGPDVPHLLVPPVERWERGLRLLEIANTVERQTGARVCQMANWYRPDPYNGAVGGSSRSHHRIANAVDLHFCSRRERNTALEAFRRQERTHTNLGIGTYSGEGSVTIHIDFGTRNYHI